MPEEKKKPDYPTPWACIRCGAVNSTATEDDCYFCKMDRAANSEILIWIIEQWEQA